MSPLIDRLISSVGIWLTRFVCEAHELFVKSQSLKIRLLFLWINGNWHFFSIYDKFTTILALSSYFLGYRVWAQLVIAWDILIICIICLYPICGRFLVIMVYLNVCDNLYWLLYVIILYIYFERYLLLIVLNDSFTVTSRAITLDVPVPTMSIHSSCTS